MAGPANAAALVEFGSATEDSMLDEVALLRWLGLPLSRPHQLVRQGDALLVAITSAEGLDAALATLSPLELNVKGGVLCGYVLPTASTKDCLLLKAAAEAGMYSSAGGTTSTRFSLADHGVVDAKISARADVDQARAQLGDVVSSLSRGVQELTAHLHAPAGSVPLPPVPAQWAFMVECSRREVHQHVQSTIAHIKALCERLDFA